jgi:hypothetical protein
MPARTVPEIAARHEMGHAVVAMVFDVPVRRASIRPGKRSFGRVVMAALPDAELMARAGLSGAQVARIVDIKLYILLAGPFAQRRFAPRSRWLTSEFNKVIEIAKASHSGSGDRLVKYLAKIDRNAERLVDFFWKDIEAGAKALVKHETLTGVEIAAAIRMARRKTRRRHRTGDPPTFALAGTNRGEIIARSGRPWRSSGAVLAPDQACRGSAPS